LTIAGIGIKVRFGFERRKWEALAAARLAKVAGRFNARLKQIKANRRGAAIENKLRNDAGRIDLNRRAAAGR
jgi:hypothetical protein